jgi:hypothetical protein
VNGGASGGKVVRVQQGEFSAMGSASGSSMHGGRGIRLKASDGAMP